MFILGGRVAEDIFFGKISTGASDDLKKAFEISHAIVTKFGMVDEFEYVNLENEQMVKHNYLGEKVRLYSEKTHDKVD